MYGACTWKSLKIEGVFAYAGWTEHVDTRYQYSTLTNERVFVGGAESFPLWFLSFVRLGAVGSLDLRANGRTTVVDVGGGFQGSVAAWIHYVIHGWYETGELSLLSGSLSDSISSWASDIRILIGKPKDTWQGMVRWVGTSGEDISSGWNRFLGGGSMDGPLVLVHPVANLSMIQICFTWWGFKDVLLIFEVYDVLWRVKNKDIFLVSLYGNGNFLGQEVAIETVVKWGPNVVFFVIGFFFSKGMPLQSIERSLFIA